MVFFMRIVKVIILEHRKWIKEDNWLVKLFYYLLPVIREKMRLEIYVWSKREFFVLSFH